MGLFKRRKSKPEPSADAEAAEAATQRLNYRSVQVKADESTCCPSVKAMCRTRMPLRL